MAEDFDGDGDLDDVRMSKVARDEKDFTPASRFEPDEHTLGLDRIDQGEGDELEDSSGHNRQGKIIGAKWVIRKPEPITELLKLQ